MPTKAELMRRADRYARKHGLVLGEPLGFGVHGIVLVAASKTRPFVPDFADAYLDEPPDYPDEVLAEWRTEKQEQFGDHWPEIELILLSLQRHGVYLVDVSPGNIAFST